MKHFGRADGTKQKYKSVFNMLLVKNIKPRKPSLDVKEYCKKVLYFVVR